MKTYIVLTHQKCLKEALLMCRHNTCFHEETSKVNKHCPLYRPCKGPNVMDEQCENSKKQ